MAKIVERIALIIKEKGVSVRSFEMPLGASNGAIGRAISKGTDITAEWLSKIIETNPDISSDWLLAGRGSMLRADATAPAAQTTPQPAPEPTIIYERDPRDIQLIETQGDLIKSLKRDLEECRVLLDASATTEKGMRTRHFGGAPSVDLPATKGGKM